MRRINTEKHSATIHNEPLCFAMDLTWVRHGCVGGTESFVCNLLEGFGDYVRENPGQKDIVLLVSRDNAGLFRRYECPEGIRSVRCNVISAARKKRILWQNLKMGKMLKSMGIGLVLEPIYYKPFLGTAGIRYVTVIHDLQALHFSDFFSKKRVAWMKFCWRNALRTSSRVLATSDYTKEDIIKKMQCNGDKVCSVPIPIVMDKGRGHVTDADQPLLHKYGVKSKEYYYTVTSQLPHKNLSTLLLAMAELKKRKSHALLPLVISGVGQGVASELKQIIEEEGLEKIIIFTGFIDDRERDLLYRSCKAFVFPSIFEGFGMPPIEAMAEGAPVLTTKCASIPEVTGGAARYVNDPWDSSEWADMLEGELTLPDKGKVDALMDKYDKRTIAERYIQIMREIWQERVI